MDCNIHMENYSKKIKLVKTAIIKYCKNCISNNWEQMFDMWLECEADMEFGDGYYNTFEKEFSQYMNATIKETLWLAAKNTIFALNAFRLYNKNAKLEAVLNFIELFLEQQLGDFDNWCEDISQAMFEETDEYEREFGNNRPDDNPQ